MGAVSSDPDTARAIRAMDQMLLVVFIHCVEKDSLVEVDGHLVVKHKRTTDTEGRRRDRARIDALVTQYAPDLVAMKKERADGR